MQLCCTLHAFRACTCVREQALQKQDYSVPGTDALKSHCPPPSRGGVAMLSALPVPIMDTMAFPVAVLKTFWYTWSAQTPVQGGVLYGYTVWTSHKTHPQVSRVVTVTAAGRAHTGESSIEAKPRPLLEGHVGPINGCQMSKLGPDVLFCMPDRTNCILLVSTMLR
jgi:hypothetical protein